MPDNGRCPFTGGGRRSLTRNGRYSYRWRCLATGVVPSQVGEFVDREWALSLHVEKRLLKRALSRECLFYCVKDSIKVNKSISEKNNNNNRGNDLVSR